MPRRALLAAMDEITVAEANLQAAHAKLRRLLVAGETEEPPADPMLEMVAAMRAACRERGIAISPDGFIDEGGAAILLGKHKSTVERWRKESAPIPHRLYLRRIQYRLTDIAEFAVKSAEENAEQPSIR